LKQWIYISAFLLCLLQVKYSFAQPGECLAGGCGQNGAGYLYPTAIITNNTGNWITVANDIWYGDWARYNVVAGNTYEWSFCAADGGFSLLDMELTLRRDDNLALLCYSDDVCGAQPKITWTATFTGVVRVQTNEYNCASYSLLSFFDLTLRFRCASCAAAPVAGCETALPFCTQVPYNFPNSVNVPNLGQINCLESSPNPFWYYLEIDQPGQLNIDIAQYSNFGFPIDVDFNLWGPFASFEAGCTAISAGTAPNVDCSYSPSAFEQANISNAQTGEIYVLLLTNFDNIAGNIQFSSGAGSTATTSCDNIAVNCPGYANVASSPSQACGNQQYFLEVENTACNGEIYFNVVGNYGSTFANEITWQVISNQTGAIVSSGGPGVNGANFNVLVGPLNPALQGNIYTLVIYDSWGDGFNGVGGFIRIDQGGVPITAAITVFTSQASTIFGVNITISSATLTVNSPSGPVEQTVEYCRDFRVPIQINNANFCTNTNIALPWTITCDASGNVIASGTHNITVYPSIPTNATDVINITWNAAACVWNVTPANDCSTSAIGDLFSISPDPSLPDNACVGGQQTFEITYTGNSAGPACCETGGPLVPFVYDLNLSQSNFVPNGTPFGGVNNAAYLNIPGSGIGGNASAINLSISMNNYCFPTGLNSFWVTLIVDGIIIYDQQSANPAPANFSQSFNLANIPGYNQNSVIEIYIYPNQLANVTYNPGANCGSMNASNWTAASFNVTLNASYSELVPSPANCVLPLVANKTCCQPNTVSNVSETICAGQSISQMSNWQNAVNVANGSCVVFSSVLPIAGSVSPDNTFPNGLNPSNNPINQTVSAFTYCDVDGSGTINAGDTYTLISTFTLTINPFANAGIGTSITFCESGSPEDLFTLLGGSPQSGGEWTGPSTLGGGSLGTFNPSINTPGTYTYTVNGISPCANANAQIIVSISAGTEAQINYAGPYCIDITTPQQALIIGAGGGTFSATPTGLNLNTSNGAIIPSLSSPGTYTVTYSIPAAGSCPAFSTTETVVITAIPANPTLSPDPACSGTSTLFTAGNGVLYEFYLNGTSQSDVSETNTFNSPVLMVGDEICVRSYPPVPFIINGIINEPQWGTPLAKSTGGPVSGFGPNNNLDAVYFKNMNGILYGAVAGRVENNSNNRILIFIDSKPGGFNNLGGWVNRTQAPYVSIENLNGGINFDPGFEPDYILAMNEANDEAFFDLYDMQNNTNNYLGSNISNLNLAYLPNSGQFDNGLGFEFAFPLSFIGNPNISFKAFAMIVNDPGLGNSAATFISNQFLTKANFGENNYGDGAIFFGSAAPDPITFNLSADCFSETCLIVQPSIPPITGFTLPDSICHDDPSINPSVVPGFTSGGNFSSLPAGLVMNPSTGEINTAASTPGTYNITYTVPANGCNPAGTTTISITINPVPTTTTIYHD